MLHFQRKIRNYYIIKLVKNTKTARVKQGMRCTVRSAMVSGRKLSGFLARRVQNCTWRQLTG